MVLMTMNEAFEVMQNLGLFAVPLNNGDWMVGSGNYLYAIDIRSDHYKDERLSIAATLTQAVSKWCEKNKI